MEAKQSRCGRCHGPVPEEQLWGHWMAVHRGEANRVTRWLREVEQKLEAVKGPASEGVEGVDLRERVW